MSQRKFVELWYFTPEAYAEAKEQRSNVESNRFELAADDERKGAATFTLVGTHSTKPSSNAVPDAMLTWAQISRAKSAFLNALPIGNYSSEYIAMFAGFYTNMDMHEELQKPKGDLVMAQYHADMRRAWFAAYEDGEPFDLAVISAEALQLSREEVRNKAHERALAELGTAKKQQQATTNNLQSNPSQSSPKKSDLKSRRVTPYTSPQKKKAPEPEFQRSFRSVDHPTLQRCHRCLGRDPHFVRKCSRTSIWNNSRKVICDWNEKSYLEICEGIHKGLELCADWQRTNGCTNRGHTEKHRCSGCASTNHGANGCPDGE
ncbi:hypothetical protein F5890DRAFT_1125799 [Lentinula detonsa]|uniref:Uncharacterized protein n=1 Tax=Lentinula detonsa TaxID=2804962 RepID=A0AA38UV91_9AGAR|nr:hypothetical protein F5890DRAFT_1125799 [Lentinula detonsa]